MNSALISFVLLITSTPVAPTTIGKFSFRDLAACEQRAPEIIRENAQAFPHVRYEGFRCVKVSDR